MASLFFQMSLGTVFFCFRLTELVRGSIIDSVIFHLKMLKVAYFFVKKMLAISHVFVSFNWGEKELNCTQQGYFSSSGFMILIVLSVVIIIISSIKHRIAGDQ